MQKYDRMQRERDIDETEEPTSWREERMCETQLSAEIGASLSYLMTDPCFPVQQIIKSPLILIGCLFAPWLHS